MANLIHKSWYSETRALGFCPLAVDLPSVCMALHSFTSRERGRGLCIHLQEREGGGRGGGQAWLLQSYLIQDSLGTVYKQLA